MNSETLNRIRRSIRVSFFISMAFLIVGLYYLHTKGELGPYLYTIMKGLSSILMELLNMLLVLLTNEPMLVGFALVNNALMLGIGYIIARKRFYKS